MVHYVVVTKWKPATRLHDLKRIQDLQTSHFGDNARKSLGRSEMPRLVEKEGFRARDTQHTNLVASAKPK